MTRSILQSPASPVAPLAVCAAMCLAAAALAVPTPPQVQVGDPIALPLDNTLPATDRLGPSMSVTPYVLGQPTRIIVTHVVTDEWNDPPPLYLECSICLTDPPTFTTQALNWDLSCLPAMNMRVVPMTASSPTTRDLFVAARAGNTLMLQRLLSADTSLTPAEPITILAPNCEYAPRGMLTAGPRPPGEPAGETLYLAHSRTRSGSIEPTKLFTIKSVDALGQTWNPAQQVTSQPGGLERLAQNPYAAVVPGGLRKGRLIVASNSIDPGAPVAEVTFSDYGGDQTPGLWAEDWPLNVFGAGLDLVYRPYSAIVPGRPTVSAAPSIAVDPKRPERVYIIFSGITPDTSTNLDLFIARSIDFGATFPPATIFRITDDKLRICSTDCLDPDPDCPDCDNWPAETDEWLPSITVDDYGGINAMFFRTQTDDSVTLPADTVADVRYARWPSDAALTGNQAPFVANLTAPGSATPHTHITTGAWGDGPTELVPQYQLHTLKASGCYVYAIYSSEVNMAPPWRTYLRRIVVGLCRADFNQNGLINDEDLGLFYEAYVAGEPGADMTADEFVDGLDEDSYLEAYCEGCPTQF